MSEPMERIEIALPDWFPSWLGQRSGEYPDGVSRQRLVLELARRNVEAGSGGPFAAAVFERRSGRLVAAGVNRVEPECCAPAHAEVMAVMAAQKKLGVFDLGAAGLPAHELVSSAQPCVMCFGAVLWSGVRSLVFSARAEDVTELLGFDEGPLPADWPGELQRRGIAVQGDVLREEGREVLRLYRRRGGLVYNSRRG